MAVVELYAVRMKPICKIVKCTRSLPSQSHHLPQPETISVLAAAIMRSSWKSNKGLQGEQLSTSIIPLGCYGMFFHQTTVCQALVQMEKALARLWPTETFHLLAGDQSDETSELSSISPATVLVKVSSGPLYCITYVGNSRMGDCSRVTHPLNLPHTTQQWTAGSVSKQCPCQGGLVSWLYSVGGSHKKFITHLVCQSLQHTTTPSV